MVTYGHKSAPHGAAELIRTAIPAELGPVVDLAPVDAETPTWLVLADDGWITRWECDTGACTPLARLTQRPTTTGEPWDGHLPALRLHASRSGRYAAVVVDYGVEGEVFDLDAGKAVMALNGGSDDRETVPFSLAFAEHAGREVLIHRTEWNRLDVTDLATGALLTPRSLAAAEPEEGTSEHYLDYFHGALHLSPGGTRIADDGWAWMPVGAVHAWELAPWLGGNVFESEDGASAAWVCMRGYYWSHAMVWLDEHRLAVGGIGDDEEDIVPGARIFDLRLGTRDHYRHLKDAEVLAFTGPGDRFFSASQLLYAVAEAGLEVWDPDTGERLGGVPGFHPTRHHRGAGELVQLAGGDLLRWKIVDPRPTP